MKMFQKIDQDVDRLAELLNIDGYKFIKWIVMEEISTDNI